MFNPLAPWTEKALNGIIQEGHRYFVRQTFNRAKDPLDPDVKGCYLLCHYKEEAAAKEHFDALKNDPNRFLYDWEDEGHRKKLMIAAGMPPGYRIFTNTFMPDWERHLTRRIKQNIRNYIQRKGWNPRGEETVMIAFYPHFGEVMIILKFRGQEVRVNFEEIEKQY